MVKLDFRSASLFLTIVGVPLLFFKCMYFGPLEPLLGALGILYWCFLLVLGVKLFSGGFSQYETMHWVMFNYGVPLLLIVVPLLWTGFFPCDRDWFTLVFFPAYGSLWIFTVVFYIIVQSGFEKTLAKLASYDPSRWDFLSLSSFCQAIIVVGAISYAMPLIADYYGAFEGRYGHYKPLITLASFIFTTTLPAFGIVMMSKIQQLEKVKDREVVYP